MAQGLHLTQTLKQTLVLAPQMQQSLALLQAPILELKALVEKELQQNPVLEELPPSSNETTDKSESDLGEAPSSRMDPTEPPADVTYDPATERESKAPVDDFQAEFERLAQLDQEWRDHFSQTQTPLRSREEDEEKRAYMFESLTNGVSLQEDLLEQMRLSDLSPEQRPIAELIIGNIDENGYLKASVDELSFSTNVPKEQIEAVLKVIQTFHPPGVGARDLRECLLLQLERAGRQDSLEYKIIQSHMEELGRRRFPEIAKALNLPVAEVQEAARRIATLDPRPGRAVSAEPDIYIVPEVFVTKSGDDYVVTLNDEHIPRLRISNQYKDLMSQADSDNEVRDYIRNKIQAGKFLIKSIHQRQQTILNIAKEIVKRQRDFMEKGVSALKPMTMAQVAEAVGVHETTVSRAVSGKYMQTPQGIYEMRYFFTSGLQTTTGDGVSNATVKEMIAELFRNESPKYPLSDEEVVRLLKEKGIVIARRTVAKYRAELGILPSNLRKVY
ncbi:RNA polymerase factor sigma-54 [Fontisphaera persica]|uniref:RNA polymerase factor sigma-54 n=1 Tax=Fontisphaera persica TaxID=2974023 RepID=UPI0024BFEEAF|nr:RNA polymerase factor sigma-54 [Fontisphaera persica]WCJ59999.1 RNA polymerase factor sigma-54 [Fontisphaera persica]